MEISLVTLLQSRIETWAKNKLHIVRLYPGSYSKIVGLEYTVQLKAVACRPDFIQKATDQILFCLGKLSLFRNWKILCNLLK